MLGIISDKDFEQELGKKSEQIDIDKSGIDKSGEVSRARVEQIKSGRGEGNVAVPDDGRRIIGEEALKGASKAELMDAFGISRQSIDAYKHGATSLSTYNQPSAKVAKHIDSVKERITRRASKRINDAFDGITEDKLSKLGPRELTAIAKDMSAIVKNMEPPVDKSNNGAPQVQYIFMAPHMKQEQDYQVVTVNE